MTYLITFACYGCHLHGEGDGTVHRTDNLKSAPFLAPNPKLARAELRLMDQPLYELDQPRRESVLASIVEVCLHRKWDLLAAHVRKTHVHVAVRAAAPPERAMLEFKAYASRQLNLLGLDVPGRKRWSRHGSTRWLKTTGAVSAAIQYVLEEQGRPMSVYAGLPE
ncbi:transposase [Paludibaculum fermentans]|uniref:transposase n=1 Tax=Paludibaculum fermentans TaxID=1473598 RepID=UPI003EBE4891